MKAALFFCSAQTPPALAEGTAALSGEVLPRLSCHSRLISVVPGER